MKTVRWILVGVVLGAVGVGVAAWFLLRPTVVNARLPDVEGLQVGSPVKAANVHAGDVSALRAEGAQFAVQVELDVDVALRTDACARLITLRTGESYLELETGSADESLASEALVPPCAIARAESFVYSLADDAHRHADEAIRRIQALGASPIVSGVLENGDELMGDKLVDSYTFDWMVGQNIAIDVRSSELDPFVMVRSPSGWQQHNDDATATETDAQLEITVQEAGTWYVQVTSAQAGETGRYELIVR